MRLSKWVRMLICLPQAFRVNSSLCVCMCICIVSRRAVLQAPLFINVNCVSYWDGKNAAKKKIISKHEHKATGHSGLEINVPQPWREGLKSNVMEDKGALRKKWRNKKNMHDWSVLAGAILADYHPETLGSSVWPKCMPKNNTFAHPYIKGPPWNIYWNIGIYSHEMECFLTTRCYLLLHIGPLNDIF